MRFLPHLAVVRSSKMSLNIVFNILGAPISSLTLKMGTIFF